MGKTHCQLVGSVVETKQKQAGKYSCRGAEGCGGKRSDFIISCLRGSFCRRGWFATHPTRGRCDGLEINCGAAAAWARAKGLVVGRRGEMAWGTSWKHPKKPFRQVINFKQTILTRTV